MEDDVWKRPRGNLQKQGRNGDITEFWSLERWQSGGLTAQEWSNWPDHRSSQPSVQCLITDIQETAIQQDKHIATLPQRISPAPRDLLHRIFPGEIFVPWLCPIPPQTYIGFFAPQCPDGKEYHSLKYMLPKKCFLLLSLNLPSPLFNWCFPVYLKLPLHRKSNRTTLSLLHFKPERRKLADMPNRQREQEVMALLLGEEGSKQQSRKASESPSAPVTQRTTVSKPMFCSALHLIGREALKSAEPSHSCLAGISVYLWLAQPRRSGGWETLSGLYRTTPSRTSVSALQRPWQLCCVHLFGQEQYNREKQF